jgi:hypothetical protein
VKGHLADTEGRTLGLVNHVLWIGGPPRSGKTAIARQLARRHGMRLYSADTQTWAHRDRALEAGIEAAQRWESLAPSERWKHPPDELLAMSLHIERGPMVIEDLRALPVSPLIVAEGSTLPASAVTSGTADRSRVVWLLPTTEFQGAQIAELETLEGRAALYWLLREMAESDARDHEVLTFAVDGSKGVVETVDVVEKLFREALETGPLAETLGERRELLREMNEAVVNQVRSYYARPWSEGDPDLVQQLFACECGRRDCFVDLHVTVAEATAAPVLAAGHRW